MNAPGLREWSRHYAALPREQLAEALQARLAREPRCPVSRYLLGCHGYDRGQPAIAVQHMMIAHRTEPQFQSAALLVFAGLNWIARRGDRLLPVLLETWEEFRRPEFDRLPRERALLDSFAEPDPGLATMPPLARRLWRLPIQTLRAQIREAVISRDAGLYPLLATSA
jgi:hypothetical protein